MHHPTLLVALMLTAGSATAQLATPNAAGVAMGHLHYRVRDVGANTAFWVRLGGRATPFAGGQIVGFPGVLVLISEGESNGGSEGSVVNHVAFRVASLAALETAGFEMESNAQFPGIASVYTPEGERIELFDDTLATNIGFEQTAGSFDPVADRHNRALPAPIVSHHLHLYVPAEALAGARQWYLEKFGATAGKRWRYDAADLPGINLNFSAVEVAQAPTQGRMLDHIGFEVLGLEEFCRELEAEGVVFDQRYRRTESGLGLAFLTDPWGTRIELTEGLGAL